MIFSQISWFKELELKITLRSEASLPANAIKSVVFPESGGPKSSVILQNFTPKNLLSSLWIRLYRDFIIRKAISSYLLGLMIPLTSWRIVSCFFLLDSMWRLAKNPFKAKIAGAVQKKILNNFWNLCTYNRLVFLTSTKFTKKLKFVGKALSPIYASASTLRCSNLTSMVGISIPTLSFRHQNNQKQRRNKENYWTVKSKYGDYSHPIPSSLISLKLAEKPNKWLPILIGEETTSWWFKDRLLTQY